MKGELILLNFPERQTDRERLCFLISKLNNTDYESQYIDELLMALHDFFGELEGDYPYMICYSIDQLRGVIDSFYRDV